MPRNTDIARREEHGLARREPISSPFRMLERFADEIDRVFDEFGVGHGLATPRFGSSWQTAGTSGTRMWTPDVEVFHRNNELVVRADLPGLSRNDIKVDVSEDRLTIQGERQHDRQEEHEGWYRSERTYGGFYREIPLPSGTIPDQAKATFRNGVLEVTMPAPPESARRGRRLEVTEAPAGPSTEPRK